MPPKPDAPLTKVTVNLYASDVAKMQRMWGQGWSVRLRQEVQHMLRSEKPIDYDPATVEDLEDE